MLLGTPKPGDPVIWSIGQAGAAPDNYPAVVVEGPHQGIDDRGREGMVITLIVQRSTRAGDPYLAVQRVLGDRFLFPRKERAEELDGTAAQPMTLADLVGKVNDALQAFLANQGSVSFEDAAATESA